MWGLAVSPRSAEKGLHLQTLRLRNSTQGLPHHLLNSPLLCSARWAVVATFPALSGSCHSFWLQDSLPVSQGPGLAPELAEGTLATGSHRDATCTSQLLPSCQVSGLV